MVPIEYNSDELKQTKKVKLIAKWFLVVEFLLLIYWGFTVSDLLEFIFGNKVVLIVFVVLFFYQAFFIGFTSHLIIKKSGNWSNKSLRMRLRIIFGCIIIPAIVTFLLFMISLFIK